jgi:hypothetical protein
LNGGLGRGPPAEQRTASEDDCWGEIVNGGLSRNRDRD